VIGALLGLMGGCLLLSYSRGALLSLCGQAVLLALAVAPSFHWRSPERWKRAALFCVTVMAVALSVFGAANLWRAQRFPVQSVIAKATFTAGEGRSSIDERSAFWGTAAALAARRPWTGWGPYSFRSCGVQSTLP
jgi:O-antigen ligase